MTNKEAIKMLKSKMDGQTDTSYEWAETVRLAVNALEDKAAQATTSSESEKTKQKSRGFWIDKGTLKDYPKPGVDVYHLLICSKCGCMHRARFLDAFKRFSNAQYCPNCGAKMDKEVEE